MSRCQVSELGLVVKDVDYNIFSIGTYHRGNKCVLSLKKSRTGWTAESIEIVKNVGDLLRRQGFRGIQSH